MEPDNHPDAPDLILTKKIENLPDIDEKIKQKFQENFEFYEEIKSKLNTKTKIFGPYEYPNELVYKGQFKDGKKEGFGTLISKNGEYFYTGYFKNDKRHGPCLLIFYIDKKIESTPYIYKSEDENNQIKEKFKITGNGETTFPSGYSYTGDHYEGMRHGYGVSKLQNGTVYEGNWVDDHKHGSGKLIGSDGKVILKGDWENGENPEIEFNGQYTVRKKKKGVSKSGWNGGRYL